MEAELLSRHPQAEIELVRGGGGIFDVTVDGKRLFCKHELDRFPEDGEILALMRQASGG